MDLRRVDLNLLKIFDSVYRLRNLSHVAAEMALTQPAISHALSRLRATLNDRLFVRTGSGLEPTPRSDEIANSIKAALAMIEDSLGSTSQFDPKATRREFQLLLSDVGELIFVPRLLQALRQQAPHAKLSVLQAARTRYEAMLRDREADLAVGNLPMIGKGLENERLFKDRWVVLRAAGGRRRRKLTVAEFQSCPHVLVEPPGTVEPSLSQTLRRKGIVLDVTVRIPHFFALPSVILASDLLATVPYSVVRNLRSIEGLDVQELPFAAPSLDVRMYWHARRDEDPAHVWLRGVFRGLFAEN